MASTSRHRPPSDPSDNSPFSIEPQGAMPTELPTASIGAVQPPPPDALGHGMRSFAAPAPPLSGAYPSHHASAAQGEQHSSAAAAAQQAHGSFQGSMSGAGTLQLPNLLFPNGAHATYHSASPVSPHAFPSVAGDAQHIFPPASFESGLLPPKASMPQAPRHPAPSSPFASFHGGPFAPSAMGDHGSTMAAILSGLGTRPSSEAASRKRAREDASATFDFEMGRTGGVNTAGAGAGAPSMSHMGRAASHSFPRPPPPAQLRCLPTGLHQAIDPGVDTIGVKYKTPVESSPQLRAAIEQHERKLAGSSSLKWYLQETEKRIQQTPGLAGDMWQGPAGTPPDIKYRYPRGNEDVEVMLDDASVLEDSWYAQLRAALAAQLEEIRASAIQTEALMERRLDRQRAFRSIPVEEVERRMEYVRAKYLKCRQAVVEKYKTYVRALKWVHLSPQRQRRGSYTREQNNVLRLWLFQHFADPYPTAQEKADLMAKCAMNDTQISNWMINSRVRIWKPCLNAVSQSQAAQETVRQLEELRAHRRAGEQRPKRHRLQGGGGASGSSSGGGGGSTPGRSSDGSGRRPW